MADELVGAGMTLASSATAIDGSACPGLARVQTTVALVIAAIHQAVRHTSHLDLRKQDLEHRAIRWDTLGRSRLNDPALETIESLDAAHSAQRALIALQGAVGYDQEGPQFQRTTAATG
jgi:hypothetical protein